MEPSNDMYVLDAEGKPVRAATMTQWGDFMQTNRTLHRTDLPDDVWVSTVFLGIDHSFARHVEHPVLWETMIFGGPHDQYQARYTSREEATKGHELAVLIAKGEVAAE